MGLTAALTRLDKAFAWSFLGFVLAIVFGGISLYTEFIKDDSPLIEFELLSNAPVIDVREKLADLEVLYRKEDISKSGQALSVFLVRVINHGSANLLAAHYDPRTPLGILVSGATLVKAEVVSSSSDYLSKAARVNLGAPNVTFEPVILEPNQWFLVKLLLLHDADSLPQLESQGKIAGMQAIPVVPPVPASDAEGFWAKAFEGSAWTQLVRLVAYFFGFILCVTVIVLPALLASEMLERGKRRRLIHQFKAGTKLPIDPADEFVFDGFLWGGAFFIQNLLETAADPKKLNGQIRAFQEQKATRSDSVDLTYKYVPTPDDAPGAPRNVVWELGLLDIERMLRQGFCREGNGQWEVLPERLRVAMAFSEFLQLMGVKFRASNAR